MDIVDLDRLTTIIFDCDGVLVDSESMSCQALNVIFKKQFSIDIGTDYSAVLGKSVNSAILHYAKKHNLVITNVSDLAKEKETAYFDMAYNNLKSFPNASYFLELLIDKQYQLVIASSGSFDKINFSLRQVGFTKYFDQIFSAEQVEHGKPSPDLLNLVLNTLNRDREECLVIEDSIAGVQSALNAGIPVIGFPGTFPKSAFDQLGVQFAINGYSCLIEIFSK